MVAHSPPCEALLQLQDRVADIDERVHAQHRHVQALESKIGEMLVGIGEAAEASRASAAASEAARESADRVVKYAFGPVNDILVRYAAQNPPPDYDVDRQEATGVQHIDTLKRRAHEAEDLARIESRSKFQLAVVAAIVTIATTVAGILTTYLTMRGH